MNNNIINKHYNHILEYDATYHELFYENTITKLYNYINDKLDDINISIVHGLGITLNKGDTSYYTSTNNFSDVTKIINELGNNFNKNKQDNIILKEECFNSDKSHNNISEDDKKDLMNRINDFIKNYDKRINQVNIKLLEVEQNVKVANNKSLKIDKRIRTRLVIIIVATDKDKTVNVSYTYGYSSDYSSFDEKTIFKDIKDKCKELIEKFECTPFDGGTMPVVIGHGFGAVIFHEACGHAMESYSIVNETSILTDKLNTKIASDKVTIIDDGSKDNLYGTINFDDQGTNTNKNILIKDGILIDYLTDIEDAKKIGNKPTGSARRENYKMKAISRMNNTYLEKGTDKVEDMIKSIKYGLYATNMGGGSVNPATGEFNFVVTHGYIIKDGIIDKPVQNISLIGYALDILKNVEMVSSDLVYTTGDCGAQSGSVPVIIGQPTIKVSSILVGGSK